MSPYEYNKTVVTPALKLLPPKMDSVEARIMLVAIGLQESGLVYRKQIGGPARGFHQFELEGVDGVLYHPSSSTIASAVAISRDVDATPSSIYEALGLDDILDCCFARLLLWDDPKPLPSIGDEESAWEYYVRNWGPGKPHPAAWQYNYNMACRSV